MMVFKQYLEAMQEETEIVKSKSGDDFVPVRGAFACDNKMLE